MTPADTTCSHIPHEEFDRRVLTAEVECLQKRRDEMGLHPPQMDHKDIPRDLVGLALSGGGIRSASFNLGLLQALHRFGLFRFVDYLSTVSGGSYIGATVAAIGHTLALEDDKDNESKDKEKKPRKRFKDNFPLQQEANGSHNKCVKGLLARVNYLTQPLVFANRYLLGLLSINLVVGCTLLLGCLLVAALWRVLDTPWVCELILLLSGNYMVEAFRPFLPAVVLLLAWLIGWGMQEWPALRGNKRTFWSIELTLVLLTCAWGIWDMYRPPDLARWEKFAFVYREKGLAWVREKWEVFVWLALPVLPLIPLSWGLFWLVRSRGLRRGDLLVPPLFVFALVCLWGILGLPPFSSGIDVAWKENTIWPVFRSLPFLLMLAWPLAWWFSPPPQSASSVEEGSKQLRVLLLAAGICLAIGVVILLATPNANWVQPTNPKRIANAGRISWHQYVLAPLLAFLVAALLPLLHPRRLLQSGLNPKRFWEPWVFNVVCYTVVFGIPLLGIWFFARHDISGHNEARGHKLAAGDFQWNKFWTSVQSEAHSAEDKTSLPGDEWIGRSKRKADSEKDSFGKADAKEDSSPGKWIWQRQKDHHKKMIEEDEWLSKILSSQHVPLLPDHWQKKQAIIGQLNHDIFPDKLDKLHEFRKCFGDYQSQGSFAYQDLKRRPEQEQERLRQLLKKDKQEQLNPTHGPEEGSDAQRQLVKESQELNRLLLEAYYPEGINRQSMVRRNVVAGWDQLWRIMVVVLLVILTLTVWFLVDLNSTSLHSFYRDQLAEAYLRIPKVIVDNAPELGLNELQPVASGAPYPLFSTTVNLASFPTVSGLIHSCLLYVDKRYLLLSNRVIRNYHSLRGWLLYPIRLFKKGNPSDGAPPQEPCSIESSETSALAQKSCDSDEAMFTDSLILSPLYCGSRSTGYRSTESFLRKAWNLSDAIALSGAAVSLPQISNPLTRLLLVILNIRLGQWLPNPALGSEPYRQVYLGRLLKDLRNAITKRAYYFVSDGGHFENLGIGPLLQRRCRLIIVSDATCDPRFQFADFHRLCRRARVEDGIRFKDILLDPKESVDVPVGLDRLRPGKKPASEEHKPDAKTEDKPSPPPDDKFNAKSADSLSRAHFVVARIVYPGEESAQTGHSYLIYLKPTMTGDEANDLMQYWLDQAEFPHDTTANQFYNEDQAESYRQLGYHIGTDLCLSLLKQITPKVDDLWEESERDIHQNIAKWVAWLRSQAAAKSVEQSSVTGQQVRTSSQTEMAGPHLFFQVTASMD